MHVSVFRCDSSVRRKIAGSILLLMFAFNAPCPIGLSQEKKVLSDAQWQKGYHGLAAILRKKDVEIISDFSTWENADRSKSFLISLGELNTTNSFLAEYLSQGGRALIASDSGQASITIDNIKLQFQDQPTVQARGYQDAFDIHMDCPKVSDFVGTNPLFSGVTTVVTNRPALLMARATGNVSGSWKELAFFPPLRQRGRFAFAMEHRNQEGGQLLVIPDQSVFANAMLGVGDNLRFTLNVIDWLKQNNRTKCLLYIGGSGSAPKSPKGVELYVPPPSREETMRALEKLWEQTNNRQKLDLANEVLEFAQEEQLIEQLVDSIKLEDIIPKNRLAAILLFIATWGMIIPFMVFLLSNRKKPLFGLTSDGLKSSRKRESNRRKAIERLRAADSLMVHFFNKTGMQCGSAKHIDPNRLTVSYDNRKTRRIRKKLQRHLDDLSKQDHDYWTKVKLEDIGRSIAQWQQLYETGALLITQSPAADSTSIGSQVSLEPCSKIRKPSSKIREPSARPR